MLETGDPDEDRRRDAGPTSEPTMRAVRAAPTIRPRSAQDSLELASAETLPGGNRHAPGHQLRRRLGRRTDRAADVDARRRPADARWNRLARRRDGFRRPGSRPGADAQPTKSLRDHLMEQLQIEFDRIRSTGHRSPPDRHGRRGRLADRRPRRGRGAAGLRHGALSARSWRGCSASSRPASWPARWPNAWPCSCATRTGWIRRWQALLANLDLLAKREIDALMRICGVDAEDLADMVAEIRALDPKPGWLLARDQPAGDARYPDAARPGRRLDRRTEQRDAAEGAGQYRVLRPRQPGRPLQVRARLHHRTDAVGQLAGQVPAPAGDDHPEGGQRDRAPAGRILRARASSTCARWCCATSPKPSRCTKARSAGSPPTSSSRRRAGTYELKFFFTAAIASGTGGEAHSAEAVRHRIKTLIDQEDAKAILSDDRIVEILKGDGIDIARRTVAKYRESMKIPSSVQRRRQKARPI